MVNYITRLVIAFVLIFLLQLYFYKKNIRAYKFIFNKHRARTLSIVLYIFFIYVNLYILVVFSFYIYSTYKTSYSFQIPENFYFAFFFTYPFWGAFILFVQSALFYIIIDLVLYVIKFFKIDRKKVLLVKHYLVFATTIFFVFYVPIRIIHDHNVVKVRKVEYAKKDLPPSLNNFKITFISDIQADYYNSENRLTQFINETNKTNPDIILIAGDLITGGPDYIQTSARYVGKLKAKLGVYTCIGDHDNWAYKIDYRRSLKEVKDAMTKVGVKMIDDSSMTIDENGNQIGISFITNTYVEKIEEGRPQEIEKQINNDAFKIMLVHQPREYLIKEAQRLGYDLFLAGHTHGGQITFFFPFLNLSPTLIETKYVRGDFKFGNMLAIVTRGWGMSLAPIRYNSTPEIVEVVLKRK
ncbi:MAG TPA: metallophosphoesterase [Ignavibacteriaceae bacterium]|nr:metallophosphoesterase [Ignavibacteriaceae bacterium]